MNWDTTKLGCSGYRLGSKVAFKARFCPAIRAVCFYIDFLLPILRFLELEYLDVASHGFLWIFSSTQEWLFLKIWVVNSPKAHPLVSPFNLISGQSSVPGRWPAPKAAAAAQVSPWAHGCGTAPQLSLSLWSGHYSWSVGPTITSWLVVYPQLATKGVVRWEHHRPKWGGSIATSDSRILSFSAVS